MATLCTHSPAPILPALTPVEGIILNQALRQAIASERALLDCCVPPVSEDERRLALVARVKLKAFGRLYNRIFRAREATS